MLDEGYSARPLIAELLVRSGTLMEDACGEMVTRLPDSAAEVLARISRLTQAGEDLLVYAAAARALALRSPEV